MNTHPTPIPFDPAEGSERDFAALLRLFNRLQAEVHPDDAPQSLVDIQANLRATPSFMTTRRWLCWTPDGDQAAAYALVSIITGMDTNQHLAQFRLAVDPDWRLQGLGSHLLAQVAAMVRAAGRTLLVTDTSSNAPAGEAFMRRLGAEVGLEALTNQLDIARLDRAQMQAWLADGESRSGAEFVVDFWDGAYPEADIDAIVAMKRVMNSAPTDDLEVEDTNFTAEQLRQLETMLLTQRRVTRWTVYARQRATGAVVGYSELFFRPHDPTTAEQGDTAVFPDFRNRGLGRWLKAAMALRIISQRPEVQRIRTGNAGSNAPMLKINHEMGFEVYENVRLWQVKLTQVEAYLTQRGLLQTA